MPRIGIIVWSLESFADLKVIVLGQGGKDSYNFLVTDTSADIYTLPDNTADSIVKSAMQSLALRIKQSNLLFWPTIYQVRLNKSLCSSEGD